MLTMNEIDQLKCLQTDNDRYLTQAMLDEIDKKLEEGEYPRSVDAEMSLLIDEIRRLKRLVWRQQSLLDKIGGDV